jgi:hypothetical protein
MAERGLILRHNFKLSSSLAFAALVLLQHHDLKARFPTAQGSSGPQREVLFGDTVRLVFQLFFPVRPPPVAKLRFGRPAPV